MIQLSNHEKILKRDFVSFRTGFFYTKISFGFVSKCFSIAKFRSNQGCGSGYFSNASASTPTASASTNKK